MRAPTLGIYGWLGLAILGVGAHNERADGVVSAHQHDKRGLEAGRVDRLLKAVETSSKKTMQKSSRKATRKTPTSKPSKAPSPVISSTPLPTHSSQVPSLTCPDDTGTTYTTKSGRIFLIECGIDHEGGDLSWSFVPNFASCIEACSMTAGCVDVSLAGTACYLKNTLGAPRVVNAAIWGAKLIAAGLKSTSSSPPSVPTASPTPFVLQIGAAQSAEDGLYLDLSSSSDGSYSAFNMSSSATNATTFILDAQQRVSEATSGRLAAMSSQPELGPYPLAVWVSAAGAQIDQPVGSNQVLSCSIGGNNALSNCTAPVGGIFAPVLGPADQTAQLQLFWMPSWYILPPNYQLITLSAVPTPLH